MGLLGMEAFPCPPFLVCREQLQRLWPWVPKGRFQQLLIRNRTQRQGEKEKKQHGSLGQGPGSTSREFQFSHSVMSDSLWHHGLQHARLRCPWPTPGACWNSGPSVMPSNYLILCHPLIHLISILPSIRVFSNKSVFCIRWPKYWSFSFSISTSNEYSGWFPLGLTGWISLQPKGLSKSLLQHHSSEASILWHSAFFIVQLSHPYMTTGKTILWLDGSLSAK